MNEQNKELFRRYGDYEEYATHQFYILARDPHTLFTESDIARYDKSAAADIEKLEKYIDCLKAYRLELAQRYNEVATAPVEKIVKLTRERKSYNGGKVYYYLELIDKKLGEEVVTLRAKYAGTDRRTALADFEQYKKDHPGITAIINTDKAYWEKH